MPPPLPNWKIYRIVSLKKRGIGVKRISRVLHVSKSTVSKYTRGIFEEEIPTVPEVRIIGHVLWDGCIYRNTICYTNSSPFLIAEFVRDMWISYSILPSEFRARRGGVVSYEVRYYCKSLVERLLKWHPTYTTRNGEGIPEIIFRLGKRKKLEFVRTFWEDEGSITIKGKIVGASRSEKALKDIQALMKEFGIKTKIYRYCGRKAVNLIVVEDSDSIEKFIHLGLIRKATFKKGPLKGKLKVERLLRVHTGNNQ